MANWQAIVGGVTYNLSDRNPFDVVSVTGVGIAPARRLTQRGPLQHGETDIGFRLDPRNVNLVLAVKAASRAAADTARDTLTGIFKPRENTPIQLRCTRDDGAVRQIDCYATGLVDMPITDNERIGSFQRVGVQLVAADPNWYDPDLKTKLLALDQGTWYLANDTIGASSVVTHALAIDDETEWHSASDLYEFTIFARTRWISGVGAWGIYPNDIRLQTTSAKWSISGTSPNVASDIVGSAIRDDTLLFTVAADRTAKLYINGTLEAEGGVPIGTKIPQSGVNPSGSWKLDWGADLTHVAVYNTVLTTYQIAQLEYIFADLPPGVGLGVASNSGNTDSFPIITIEGPVTNPVITNNATGESLSLTVTLEAAEVLTIDTRYGYKTITDAIGGNQIAVLDPSSDLATFRLVPGINEIETVTDDDDYEATITLAWHNRYMGL